MKIPSKLTTVALLGALAVTGVACEASGEAGSTSPGQEAPATTDPLDGGGAGTETGTGTGAGTGTTDS